MCARDPRLRVLRMSSASHSDFFLTCASSFIRVESLSFCVAICLAVVGIYSVYREFTVYCVTNKRVELSWRT